MKGITASAIAAFAVIVPSAGAAIGITQAPAGPGYKNLTPYPNSNPGPDQGRCVGTAGYFSSTDTNVRLQFGWFANTQGGIKQFFMNSHGSVQIVQTNGSDTLNDSWSATKNGSGPVSTLGIAWTDNEAGTGTPPGSTSKVTGVAGFYRARITSIAPGEYTLTQTTVLDKGVSDGWATYAAGTVFTSSCYFTVNP